jgi:hypothetical protein
MKIDRPLSEIRRSLTLWLFMVGVALVAAQKAHANVFLAKDEALAAAFGAGVEVAEKSVVFSAEQKSRIESRSQAKVSSNLLHYYEGRVNGAVTGYAVIDAHISARI